MEINGNTALLLTSSKGQNLVNQLFGPLGSQHNLNQRVFKLWMMPSILPHPKPHDLGLAHDRGQDVVEIMSNTTGEGANGLHLLGMTQLFFQLHLFRNIKQGNNKTSHPSLRIMDCRPGKNNGTLLTVSIGNRPFKRLPPPQRQQFSVPLLIFRHMSRGQKMIYPKLHELLPLHP